MSTITATNVRHRIIAVSMLMAFILYLDRICLAEIVKSASFKTDLPLTKEEIGRILGAFFFSYAIFQVPTGWASDRFGARKMLTAYIVLWSIFTGLTGFMSSFAGLLIMRLLCGAAEAGAYPTSGAIIRRWMPLDSRARSSAMVAFGGRIGGTLAPFITAWMVIELGHWRRPLWIDGAVGLIIAAIYWHVVRDRPEEHPDCNDAERAIIGQPPVEPPVPTSEFLGMLGAFCRSPSLWLNSAGQLCTNIGWGFLITWLPTYLKEQKGVEDIAGGRMVTVVLAFGMVGQLFGGWVADLSVRRFGLRWGRVLPMFVGGCLGGSAYVVCLNVDSAWGIVACCCVVSFAVDMGNPATWAFMQDVGGRATAAAFGWGNMWGNFGASAISMLVPFMLELGKSGGTGQRNVFILCASALFLYGFIALALDATKPLQGFTLSVNPMPGGLLLVAAVAGLGVTSGSPLNPTREGFGLLALGVAAAVFTFGGMRRLALVGNGLFILITGWAAVATLAGSSPGADAQMVVSMLLRGGMSFLLAVLATYNFCARVGHRHAA